MNKDDNEDKPQLWMIVGGNGAGKSTFFKQFLQRTGMPFVNADLIAADLYPEDPEGRSREAAGQAEEMRYKYLAERKNFCFETVFSHPSKVDFIADAKAKGYEIVMVFIHLEHNGLNKARISQRVAGGGHNVPDLKVEERIVRTLGHVKSAIPLCDRVMMYDNSKDGSDAFMPVLSIENGVKTCLLDPMPKWAAKF